MSSIFYLDLIIKLVHVCGINKHTRTQHLLPIYQRTFYLCKYLEYLTFNVHNPGHVKRSTLKACGATGIRTPDPCLAKAVL